MESRCAFSCICVQIMHDTNSSKAQEYHTLQNQPGDYCVTLDISSLRFYIKSIVATLAALWSFNRDLDSFHNSTSGLGTLGSSRTGGWVGLKWGDDWNLPYSTTFWWWSSSIYILTHTGTMGMQEASSTNIPHCQLSNRSHLLLQTRFHFPGVMGELIIFSK